MGHRIGYGSYEPPNREQSKEELRNRFLKAVSEYAKHVLEDLYSEPFKLYLQAGLGYSTDTSNSDLENLSADEQARRRSQEWYRHRWNHPEWSRKFEAGPIVYDSRKEAFRRSLFEWSRRNNLNAVWCREYAYETLDYWSYSQPAHDHLKFQPNVKMRRLFSLRQSMALSNLFKGPSLHPQLYPLEVIQADLQHRVKMYIDNLKSCAEAQGYVPTPERYKSKYGEDHFRWLVERIVKQKSFQQIVSKLAAEYEDGLDHSTVSKPVIALAKAIELPY